MHYTISLQRYRLGKTDGSPGLAFETWDPRNQFSLGTPLQPVVLASESGLSRLAEEGIRGYLPAEQMTFSRIPFELVDPPLQQPEQ